MDFGTFHGIYTVVLLIIMVGIIVWAFSKRRKAAFDEAANLVFADDKKAAKPQDRSNQG